MSKKFIVDPKTVFGLQDEVQKNLKSAFNKQNSDYVNCLLGFHRMPLSERMEIFGIKVSNQWSEQKNKISVFYAKVYETLGLQKKEIDWTATTLPEYSEEFPTLEFIDRSITGKQWVVVYKKMFGDSTVYVNDYSKDIDKMTKEHQGRPEGNYCLSHFGGIEPDAQHLNKSYDDFCSDGNKYMIPIEGIIASIRKRFETGEMLDVKGATRFHALDSGGRVIGMFRDGDGQFGLVWCFRYDRNSDFGPRQVNF